MVVRLQTLQASHSNALREYAENKKLATLAGYRANPDNVEENFSREQTILSGGYAYRQLFELIQNAADAVTVGGATDGIIRVELDRERLRVSNTGAPLDEGGVKALLQADTSSKRDNQIGRFGIGFKSLLNLGGQVDILSKSIGLRFDPDECRRQIRAYLNLPIDAPAPGMRLADCLDPNAPNSLFRDPAYSAFDTVVTAALDEPESFEMLCGEIERFPAEFLLFLDADVELEFYVEGTLRRSLMRMAGDEPNRVLISEDGKDVEKRFDAFHVFKTDICITDDRALRDATNMQARDTVPLSWAVPIGGRYQAGKFWSFFPTQSDNGLRGILNAPWKLNNDRTSIIDGPWNTALMEEAADAVSRWMGDLATDDEPGAVLDAYPRKLEREGDLHAPFTRRLSAHIAASGTLPDAKGRMQPLHLLKRHPVADYKLIERWAAISDQPKGLFLHPSCYRIADRLSRLDGVLQRSGLGAAHIPAATPKDWFASHKIRTHEQSRAAIGVAATALSKGLHLNSLQTCPIVLDTTDELRAVEQSAICEDGVPHGSLYPVARDLLTKETQADLGVLGIRKLARDVSRHQLETALASAGDADPSSWEPFWELAARSESDMLDTFLKAHAKCLRLRTREGLWVWREEYVQGVAEAPDAAALDERYFKDDLGIALPEELLGLPRARETFRTLDLRQLAKEHGEWVEDAFREQCNLRTGQRPRGTPRLLHRTTLPAGSTLSLRYTGTDPFARLITQHVMRRGAADDIHFRSAKVQSQNRADFYPQIDVPHPVWVLICKIVPARIGSVLIPVQALTPELVALAGTLDFELQAPLAWLAGLHKNVSMQCGTLGIRSAGWGNQKRLEPGAAILDRGSWTEILNAASVLRDLPDQTIGLWNQAAHAGVVPATIPSAEGSIPIDKAYVTPNRAHAAERVGQRVFWLTETGCALWEAKGAKRLPTTAKWTHDAITGEPKTLLEAWPELARLRALVPDLQNIGYLRVEGLKERLADTVQTRDVHFDPTERKLLIDSARVGGSGREDEIATILSALAPTFRTADNETCPWHIPARTHAKNCCAADRAEPRLDQTDAEIAARLAALVGDDIEVFENLLPKASRSLIGMDVSAAEVARLALAVNGAGLLQRMVRAGHLDRLNPPKRFGERQAIDFVRTLGLPDRFAESTNSRLSPEVAVAGPSVLNDLHDYQKEVVAGIDSLMRQGSGRRRAVVSLPTGGGKTRVAVEAAVTKVLNGTNKRAVLWIAQKEELCEQAVQSFADVWAARGNPGERLRVIRYWGGLTAQLEITEDQPTVVVATIQTAFSRTEQLGKGLLDTIGLLIVDECHGATEKSYTELLRTLNLQTGREASRETEVPVVGLSATPWRGHDEHESRRLARIFDQRLLPADQEGLHKKLRQREILCHLDYQALDINETVSLTQQERSYIEKWKQVPDTLLASLADSETRNDRIVHTIEREGAASVLLFANTLDHAMHLAVLLNQRGISAAAVSGNTDPATRRHFIQAFRDGKIRVLCNFGVLTTGFDAPRTDMVLIARPVFSPVLYMQMVGRGLRGPAHGGTERCKIVTVLDNLEEYGRKSAHDECARYFQSDIRL